MPRAVDVNARRDLPFLVSEAPVDIDVTIEYPDGTREVVTDLSADPYEEDE